MTRFGQPSRGRRIAVQCGRVVLFAAILALIHWQHARRAARQPVPPLAQVDLQYVQRFFPTATAIGDPVDETGGLRVLDANGRSLGFVLQTSPQSDRIIGFSGPTNTLIAQGPDRRIVGLAILSSGDTRDHVKEVREDPNFLQSLDGLTAKQAAQEIDVDAVSGATLTSLAIHESVLFRLSGETPSLRFPDPLTLAQARQLFASAAALEKDPVHASLWHVNDQAGSEIGTILRTSPAADNIIGYQGPTEALIGFGPDGLVCGMGIGTTFDNEEYVAYVRDDEYFRSLFNGMTLEQLAELNLEAAHVEGVSGATMTSMAVAEGLTRAAAAHRESLAVAQPPPSPWLNWTWRDLGTAAVIIGGLAIGLTPLRSRRWLRIGFQGVLIVYLGLINGDMISQAMIVGWAQNGVPWRVAGGLILLTAAAFVVPLVSGRNIYCTHLCPHGAVQQLLKKRLPWRMRLPGRLSQALRMLPVVLLAWCVVVAMAALPFSLVDIEPFDAWVFRVAGWPTILVAVVGLLASLFVPMAYCRYGCPTGTLLNYLRYHSRSDRWSRRDWLAMCLIGMAAAFWIV